MSYAGSVPVTKEFSRNSKRDAAGDRSRVRILRAINSRKNYPFTIRELAGKVNLSSSATHHHLLRLRETGYVTWGDGVKRTLRITPHGVAHLQRLSNLRDAKRGKGRA